LPTIEVAMSVDSISINHRDAEQAETTGISLFFLS
jgi:hypothetical protein